MDLQALPKSIVHRVFDFLKKKDKFYNWKKYVDVINNYRLTCKMFDQCFSEFNGSTYERFHEIEKKQYISFKGCTRYFGLTMETLESENKRKSLSVSRALELALNRWGSYGNYVGKFVKPKLQRNIKKMNYILRTSLELQSDEKQRYRNLCLKLFDRGLHFRNDSILCKGYVYGGKGSIDSVVDMMQEMTFFFEETPYVAIRNQLRNDEDFFGSNELSSFDISAEAKQMSMNIWIERMGGLETCLFNPILPNTLRKRIVASLSNENVVIPHDVLFS
jgi:hypothetical protein